MESPEKIYLRVLSVVAHFLALDLALHLRVDFLVATRSVHKVAECCRPVSVLVLHQVLHLGVQLLVHPNPLLHRLHRLFLVGRHRLVPVRRLEALLYLAPPLKEV